LDGSCHDIIEALSRHISGVTEKTRANYQVGSLVSRSRLEPSTSRGFVREQIIPTERPPLVGEVVPIFAVRGCCVVSATDSYGR
jgi:hypothetical protein